MVLRFPLRSGKVNPMIEQGTLVRVYWNLHRHCYSVQTMTNRGWRVALHSDAIHLAGARFTVSAAGRERVRRESRKNVHAFICGTWLASEGRHGDTHVTYNPYVMEGFHIKSGGLVTSADEVCGTTDCTKRPILTIH
jgi:hypothetical protein